MTIEEYLGLDLFENIGGVMRKHITKEWLKSFDPCESGYKYWIKQNKPYLPDFLRQCLKDDHFNWANWLIVRCMDKKQYQAYAIFAAEQVLEIFEKQHPDDKRPRRAIEAAKKVLKYDSEENRNAAYAAADAAYAAAYAAADAAADAAYAAANAAADAAYAAAYAAADAAAKLKKEIIEQGIKIMGLR